MPLRLRLERLRPKHPRLELLRLWSPLKLQRLKRPLRLLLKRPRLTLLWRKRPPRLRLKRPRLTL